MAIEPANSRNLTRSSIMGFLIGAILSFLVVLIIDVSDIRIKDKGCGIESLERAMEPLYTTDPENERSGMGLPIMKTFSDTFKLRSAVGKGTTVIFTKRVNSENG